MGGVVLPLLVVCTLGLLAGQGMADLTFTIVHFNDMHSRLEPADAGFVLSCSPIGNGTTGSCYGGFGKLKTIADRARAWGPTLLLDSGDEFVGTLYSYFYRGAEASVMQNMIGVDNMTLGNHEFDYGPETTRDYIKNLTFPVVTCNVVPTPESSLFGVLVPGGVTVDLTLANGTSVKVGLVGWTTTDTSVTSSPGPHVQFLPLVSSVQACVDELQSKGINIIIGLGHARAYYQDGDYEVASQVRGIDVVLGDHSHTLFYNGVPPLTADGGGLGPYPYMVPSVVSPGKSVPYFQVLAFGRYAGVTNVTFDDQGNLVSSVGNPVFLSNSSIYVGADGSSVEPVPADQMVVAKTVELGGATSPLALFKTVIVGSTDVPLSTNDETGRIVRKQETNLGNLITDAMLWEIKNKTNLESVYGPINIAFENGGGIRAEIPVGNIIINQMSGLAVQWDSALPVGSRIVSANLVKFAPNGIGNKCLGAAILNSNSSFYLVASNDFTIKGGDGYTAMGLAPYVLKVGRVLADIVNDYITAFTPIAPRVEGRNCRFNSTLASSIAPNTQMCGAPPCSLAAAF